MAKEIRVTPDNIEASIKSASEGDRILLTEKGKTYFIDRTFMTKDLIIEGTGDHPSDCVIKAGKGRLFRDQGGSTFKNFSVAGNGSFIEAEGHGTSIEDFIGYGGNIPVKLAGDDHLFWGGALYNAKTTGIEINGGYYLLPELSKTPLRLKKELGLIPGLEPSQEWTQEQLKTFSDLYYHRNMNNTVRHVLGVRCGNSGGGDNGAFIKIVPCGGGVEITNNFGLENRVDVWNDFPSDTPFEIANNTLIGASANSIFVEGYVSPPKAYVHNNVIWDASTGLFVSAFPGCESWDNFIGFKTYGKRVHGLANGREEMGTSCVLPEGKLPDILVSNDTLMYGAHQVAAQEANYNFDADIRQSLVHLERGAFLINAPDVFYGPDTSTNFTMIDKLPVDFVELVNSNRYLSGTFKKIALSYDPSQPDTTPVNPSGLTKKDVRDVLEEFYGDFLSGLTP